MNNIIAILKDPLFGGIFAIISFVAAIYLYFKGKRSVSLAYQRSELPLIGQRKTEHQSDLEVRFSGIVVPRVTVSKFVIWNNGTDTINGRDIVDSDPISLLLRGSGNILRATVSNQSREVCDFSVSIVEPKKLIISFDYIDPQDGCVLEILHSDEPGNLDLIGTVRGIPKGFANMGDKIPSDILERFGMFGKIKHLSMFGIIFGFIMMMYGVYGEALSKFIPDALKGNPPPSMWIVMGIIYLVTPACLLWISRRRHPASLDLSSSAREKAEAAQSSQSA